MTHPVYKVCIKVTDVSYGFVDIIAFEYQPSVMNSKYYYLFIINIDEALL